MFKHRKAYEISNNTNLTDKKIREQLITPVSKQSENPFDSKIENIRVMKQWILQKNIIKAENKIIFHKYMKKAFWHDIMIILLAALIITIGYDYFIGSTGSTGLFSEGLSAFAKLFAVLTYPDNIQNQSSFYFIYYFAINVPLIIFSFWKLGVRFTVMTLLTMATQIAFDQIIIHIPEINPESLYMVINTQELAGIPTAWNSAVWLFIKAICGGMLVGIGYGLPYRIGACSGGEDFAAIYISNRYEKSIGKVNRVAYAATFAVAIIVNTVLLDPQYFDADIKYGQVYQNMNPELWHNIQMYVQSNPGNFSKEALPVIDVLNKIEWSNTQSVQNTLNSIQNGTATGVDPQGSAIKVTSYAYKEFCQEIVRTDFNKFTTGEVSKMRFLFIFGPSIFASCLLIYVTTKFTDIIYPTHTVKTYLISTERAEEMKTALINLGYRNNIIEWDADIQVRQQLLDRKAVLLTMTISNWKEIEPDLLLVDPSMIVNVLKTDKVKGKFDYRIRSDRELRQTWHVLKQDKEWMAEIEKASKEQTKIEHEKYLLQRKEIVSKYTFKNVLDLEKITTVEQLDYWKQANLAKVKDTKKKELLKLEHEWLLEWADSQKQLDDIKRYYTIARKQFGTVNKASVKTIEKSYNTALEKLEKTHK